MTRSLRFRLTILILLVLGVGMSTVGVVFYFAARHVLRADFDEWMLRQSQAVAHAMEEHTGARFTFEYGGLPAFEDHDRPAYFQLWKPNGETIARSKWLGAGDLPRRPGDQTRPLVSLGTMPDGRPGRLLQVALVARWESRSQPLPPARRGLVTVVVARSTQEIDQVLARLRDWLLGAGSLLVLLVVGATALSVWRGLRPAVTLAGEIARIDELHLGERVSTADLPRELEPAVTKLNELLGRLEESFARERRFTADVSHELRTPLAGLRSILEVAASQPRSEAEYRRALADAMRVIGDLQAMTENLLELARLEARQIELHRRWIPLRDFLAECWRPYAERANARGLRFRNEIAPEAALYTDRDKLRIVVTNLLANAAEYTAERGQVVVRSGAEPGVALDVSDSGPAIPQEALPRIFDRLYRKDPARTPGTHCGIGLALVRAVSEVLDLDVTASNLPDGSVRFRLRERRPPADPAHDSKPVPRAA